MKHEASFRRTLALSLIVALLIGVSPAAFPGAALGQTAARTYTTDADFDEGTLVNVSHDVPDQLQLDSEATPFAFIWVAASARGTIIKIDTVTGEILGEYWSASNYRNRNPSRTTVDYNGNIWAGNRDENSDNMGSIVHIGLQENGQCVDRNGNGKIETSTGLADILDWDFELNFGVVRAADECIIHFVRTSGSAARTLAVDFDNNVWVGGYGRDADGNVINRIHELYDGDTGEAIDDTQFIPNCGGYGGLYDPSGVLWSADPATRQLLRYDTVTESATCILLDSPEPPSPRPSYGLAIDTNGYIWNSNYGCNPADCEYNSIAKIAPDGTIVGFYHTGDADGDRGVAVTPADNHIWVANSWGATVSRLTNDGELAAIIDVGDRPTGLAVDAAGKVWVTNRFSDNVMRINPDTNAVDLTVELDAGAEPYNYSDMTGSTLIVPPNHGTWTVVYDSGVDSASWGSVSWNADVSGDGMLSVTAASSNDGVTFVPAEDITNGADLTITNGRYLKVSVSFTRASTGESPVLYDLTINNRPPIADPDGPYLGAAGSPITCDGTGSFDPDGGPLTYDWDWGDGNSSPDAGAAPSHTYTEAGIYRVCLIVNDTDVDSDQECTTAVVYDPSAGFVTGGGWIDSPQGAYTEDPSLAGKATFGFVAKYKKGADTPDGNTEFQFHNGDLNFHSTSYDWLLVTGSDYAKFKGSGAINGEGIYKFKIWAGDGTGPNGEDTFRIKIWTENELDGETVVYDNGFEASGYGNGQPLSRGAIIIHTTANKLAAGSIDAAPTIYLPSITRQNRQ